MKVILFGSKENLVNKSILKSFRVNTLEMELSEKEFVSISGILNRFKNSKQIINVREPLELKFQYIFKILSIKRIIFIHIHNYFYYKHMTKEGMFS